MSKLTMCSQAPLAWSENGEDVFISDAAGRPIGKLWGPERAGNARLWSTAPRLLATLEACAAVFDDMVKSGAVHTIPHEMPGYFIGPQFLVTIRTAIRDARGDAANARDDR